MTIEKLFEKATRLKVRYHYNGSIAVEDLWNLDVKTLDEKIFKPLNAQLKQAKEESLLQTKSAADEELEVKIEIVKYIVKEKQAEAAARLQDKELKVKEQKIMEALAANEEKELTNKSPEDLQKMLDEIRALRAK